MDLQKRMLKNIPKEYHFKYLLAWKKLMNCREKLTGYEPKDDKDIQWLREILKEYKRNFVIISDINNKGYMKIKFDF